MSLGKPNLYLAGALIAGDKAADVTTLAGLTINWGEESRVDFAGPATMTAEILVRAAAMPAWSNGTQVGVTDPASGRCLFAGHVSNLVSAADEAVEGAQRITLTATSPLADLANHTVYDFDWAAAGQSTRFNTLAGSMARGWIMAGYTGLTWIGAGRLKFQEKEWLTLCEWWCRSNIARYHDTSAYVPGSGLVKRLTITAEREKTTPVVPSPGTAGVWWTASKPAAATGVACLPANLIARGIEWEKNPEDTITDVKVTTYGAAVVAADDDSKGFTYNMEAAGAVNHAMQDAYGFRQLSLDTDISSGNVTSLNAWLKDNLVPYWLDADTKWRPTAVELPNASLVATEPMLNLLAVDTRHMAILYVPAFPGINPAKIHAYVNKGRATWTGKKWTATLTLGRTFDN